MVEMSAAWHKLFLYEHKVILKLSDRWLGHYFYFEQIHREKSIELVWKWQKERLLIWEQIQHSFLQGSLKKCSSKMNKQSKQRIQKTIIVSKQGVKGGFRRAVPISHDWNRRMEWGHRRRCLRGEREGSLQRNLIIENIWGKLWSWLRKTVQESGGRVEWIERLGLTCIHDCV